MTQDPFNTVYVSNDVKFLTILFNLEFPRILFYFTILFRQTRLPFTYKVTTLPFYLGTLRSLYLFDLNFKDAIRTLELPCFHKRPTILEDFGLSRLRLSLSSLL